MSQTVVRTLTLSLDTSAYTAADVLAATQELPNAVKMNDGGAFLESLTVIDKDDQGAAFDVYVMDANVSMGSENSAPNISDANAESILGKIAVGTGDYSDLGGVKVATIKNLHIPIQSASGGASIYVAAVNGAGTPTYTAAGIVLRFGIVYG
jgi:hypothetical protein